MGGYRFSLHEDVDAKKERKSLFIIFSGNVVKFRAYRYEYKHFLICLSGCFQAHQIAVALERASSEKN